MDRILTYEQDKQILELSRSGFSQNHLAEVFCVSPTAIYNSIKRSTTLNIVKNKGMLKQCGVKLRKRLKLEEVALRNKLKQEALFLKCTKLKETDLVTAHTTTTYTLSDYNKSRYVLPLDEYGDVISTTKSNHAGVHDSAYSDTYLKLHEPEDENKFNTFKNKKRIRCPAYITIDNMRYHIGNLSSIGRYSVIQRLDNEFMKVKDGNYITPPKNVEGHETESINAESLDKLPAHENIDTHEIDIDSYLTNIKISLATLA
ncbi:hypothetical protein P9477_23610 [Enterobacter mori]|uniref:hypothetical protein n=1 Tax=Enterobacter mori TaxID=539813 RepID=UPI00398B6A50